MNEEKNISETTSINREFKDRIFKFIFGHEKNRYMALSLYNAMSGRNCTNPEDIEITTIGDILYITSKNDVSFLIDGTMNIYEHQSTYSPNMPVRMLVYAGKLYEKYIEKNIGKGIYSSVQQKLPVPKLICFYNGIRDMEDRAVFNFSDAFETSVNSESDIDVRVTMININYGRNQKLMEACKPLKEYSWLMNRIRTYTEKYKENGEADYAEKAADRVVTEMPENWMLRPFLSEHRSEVRSMWMTEYNEQKTWDEIRAAYQEEIARQNAELKEKDEMITIQDARLKELQAKLMKAETEIARLNAEKI